jgi:predicted restriction endonuclease
MYRGCAIPGCSVAWDYIVIHHLQWFRNLGLTDIDNLLPLCTKHHHLAHEGRWQLTLDPARNLTITKPDSTQMTTGPPTVLAA